MNDIDLVGPVGDFPFESVDNILALEEDLENSDEVDKEKDGVAKFLLSLRIKDYISDKGTEKIAQKFEDLLQNCLSDTCEALKSFNINLSEEQINTACDPINALTNSFQNLNTRYKQNIRFQQYHFVSPIEISINEQVYSNFRDIEISSHT